MGNMFISVLLLAALCVSSANASTPQAVELACAKMWGGNRATGVCESVSERGRYAFFVYDWRGIGAGKRLVFASVNSYGDCEPGRTFGMRFHPEFNGQQENLQVDDYALSGDVRLILSSDRNAVLTHPGRTNATQNIRGWMIQLQNCRRL